MLCVFVFFFKQKTAYEMRMSDWSSDVCSSDLAEHHVVARHQDLAERGAVGGHVHAVVGDHAEWLADDVGHALAGLELGLLVGGEPVPLGLPLADRRGTVRLGEAVEVRYVRSEEHTSELQSLMRISYAVFWLKKKKQIQ